MRSIYVVVFSAFHLLFFYFPSHILAQDTLNLKEAIILGKQNNRFLKTLQYETDIQKANIVTAGIRSNPMLNNQSLFMTNSKNFYDGTEFAGATNRQLWWQLTKQFQTFGKRQAKIDLATKGLDIVDKNILDFERNLYLDIANKYLDISLIENNLNFIREVRENIDSLVYINEIRLANLAITETELTRTRIIAEQYALKETIAKQDLNKELLNLRQIIAVDSVILIDERELFQLDFFSPSLDSLLELTQEKRSDVLLANTNIEIAKANTVLQKAYRYPNIELGTIYNPQNTVPYVGVYATLPLPIFDYNQGERQKAKVLEDQAQVNLEAVTYYANQDVVNAYQVFKNKQKNILVVNEILAKSEQVLNTIRYAYLKGNTTIIDFLEAQRTLYDAQIFYNEALAELKRSYIYLLYVTGLINDLDK